MKLIGNQSLSYGMVNFYFGVVYIHQLQFKMVPSVENFATSPNWLFVVEVCNTVWCGEIKDRII